MLVNTRSDAAFQRYLDQEEQRLHTKLYPVLVAGIRLQVNTNGVKAQTYVEERGQPILYDHYRRIYRDQYNAVVPKLTTKEAGVSDFVAEQTRALLNNASSKITNISTTLRNDITKLMLDGVAEGKSNNQIAREIRDAAPDMSKMRAATIARTETHNASMAAIVQTLKFKNVAVTQKTWWTAQDDRVRESHADVHGETIAFDDAFEVGDSQMMYPGDESLGAGPEEIINCLTGGTVIDARHILAATRHLYSGKLIQIRTARTVLEATPNHPIATPRGWVAAGALNVGDNVLYVPLGERDGAHAQVNGEDRPATLKKIFDALAATRFVDRVAAASVDFHGDRPTSDVEIVFADGVLLNNIEPGSPEGFGCFAFTKPNASIGSHCAPPQLAVIGSPPAHCSMSGGSVGAALLDGSLGGKETVASENIGGLQARSKDEPSNHAATDVKLARDARFWPTPGVESDQILDIVVRESCEHVYNLETDEGVYTANGVICHNCRCSILYETAPQEAVKPPPPPPPPEPAPEPVPVAPPKLPEEMNWHEKSFADAPQYVTDVIDNTAPLERVAFYPEGTSQYEPIGNVLTKSGGIRMKYADKSDPWAQTVWRHEFGHHWDRVQGSETGVWYWTQHLKTEAAADNKALEKLRAAGIEITSSQIDDQADVLYQQFNDYRAGGATELVALRRVLTTVFTTRQFSATDFLGFARREDGSFSNILDALRAALELKNGRLNTAMLAIRMLHPEGSKARASLVSMADYLGALTAEKTFGWGHGKAYYAPGNWDLDLTLLPISQGTEMAANHFALVGARDAFSQSSVKLLKWRAGKTWGAIDAKMRASA